MNRLIYPHVYSFIPLNHLSNKIEGEVQKEERQT